MFYILNKVHFLTFPACFSIPIIFSNFNCSNLSSLRNLQEQVKKAFCYQKLFWPFNVWINWSSDFKNFCKFSAFNFEFQKFFSITRTIFSHSRVRTILVTKYHFTLMEFPLHSDSMHLQREQSDLNSAADKKESRENQ